MFFLTYCVSADGVMKWKTCNGSVWYIINRDNSEYKKSVIKKAYIPEV